MKDNGNIYKNLYIYIKYMDNQHKYLIIKNKKKSVQIMLLCFQMENNNNK